MILPLLTFIMDPIMNLMSRSHYKYEKMKHHSLCSEIPKNYSPSLVCVWVARTVGSWLKFSTWSYVDPAAKKFISSKKLASIISSYSPKLTITDLSQFFLGQSFYFFNDIFRKKN